jgi:hypothetical protein
MVLCFVTDVNQCLLFRNRYAIESSLQTDQKCQVWASEITPFVLYKLKATLMKFHKFIADLWTRKSSFHETDNEADSSQITMHGFSPGPSDLRGFKLVYNNTAPHVQMCTKSTHLGLSWSLHNSVTLVFHYNWIVLKPYQRHRQAVHNTCD